MEKMHFTRMDQGTDNFRSSSSSRAHAQNCRTGSLDCCAILAGHGLWHHALRSLSAISDARCARGKDEEYVVVALLHDACETLDVQWRWCRDPEPHRP
jgi:hypothetical protein